MKSIAQLREEYVRGTLDESQAHPDPIEQFARWLDEAIQAQVMAPNAMMVATTNVDGLPSARVVLLKGVEHDCFVFYTNYESRKGRELGQSPHAALVFFWAELERQVRIEGDVERTSGAGSDAYFATRPRPSQLGAWASQQSEPLASRDALVTQLSVVEARFGDGAVPRPPHWGGYALRPRVCEFWQGRPQRLHDRIVYTRGPGETWQRQRLSP